MSLLTISIDLLFLITEWVSMPLYPERYNFSTHSCTKSLASLALVSRRLNQITTPILYRTFVQTQYTALPISLRLLVEKPEVGSLVKKIVISEIEDIDGMDMLGFSSQDVERLGLDEQAVGYFEHETPGWMTHLEEGQWQAVIALLLLLLPSLEEIDIESYSGEDFEAYRMPYIDAALAYAVSQQRIPNSGRCLRKLKTVSMAYCDEEMGNTKMGDTEMGMSIDVLLSFCELPSLTSAKIQMACDEDWIVPSPAPQYNVEELELDNSNIAPDALIKILRCFPRLKKLYYENGGPMIEDFLPQYLGRGIAHLHGCLEELTVIDQQGYANGEEEQGSIGSLAEFKNLRKIDMYYECFLKGDPDDDEDEHGEDRKPKLVHVLPPSVEQLTIEQCQPGIWVQLWGVMD
ncbi:hypothetical protein N431DRAFT_394015 [Stipitochalara longipes BDJ]|nr:hypothetical protein N431DRAFT_394015 [Stipitochalara longipes BDJ]